MWAVFLTRRKYEKTLLNDIWENDNSTGNLLEICLFFDPLKQKKKLNTYIWVNYNDLTATSLESWLVREIIPKWP